MFAAKPYDKQRQYCKWCGSHFRNARTMQQHVQAREVNGGCSVAAVADGKAASAARPNRPLSLSAAGSSSASGQGSAGARPAQAVLLASSVSTSRGHAGR
mmetsp:Transcript_13317/g.34203  ORF Transcript_13317/g.34203 Transcript_13317/m.34203 type:complete len:100 (+) Transcript_13317:122-421(+)